MTSDPRRPGDDAAREPLTHEGVMADLANIQVAHEELRVAEEEMRVQQEQITQLLLQHDAERRWRGQLSALLPLGLCITDGNGALLETNPALATHLGTALARLRGKPLSVFLAAGDVKQFRAALRALSAGTATEHRLSLAVQPRDGSARRFHLFGFAETTDPQASAARVQWILVPQELGGGPDDASRERQAAPRDAAAGEVEQPVTATELIGLAASLAEFSALPVGDYDRQRLLGRMATLVRGAVPGADWVSITVGSPAEPQRLGSDSAEAQRFDEQQLRARQGPCLDAYETGAAVVTGDVTADERWPALAGAFRTGAVRSVLAVPLREDGTTTGVVNVYSAKVGAFGGAVRRIAELAAASVASVLQTVTEREAMQHLAENLERALTSRSVIDQAKGVIMTRLGVNADDAFARMVNLSSRLNVKGLFAVEGVESDVGGWRVGDRIGVEASRG